MTGSQPTKPDGSRATTTGGDPGGTDRATDENSARTDPTTDENSARTDRATGSTDEERDRPGATTGANERELAVDAEGLELTYSDGTEAVAGVSLSVPRGEFFGFLGPNGAGKTTTIKLLATLLAPTGGRVRINGYDAVNRPTAVRATVGYMAQETSVDEELTARENLAFACDAYGVPRGRRDGRIDELLDLVDLADVADTPAGRFSGGMKKRLDAATALVHDPELVFLDEPTTGLDPEARNRLWAYFERISDRGTTVFLTTQYLAEADRLCDRLAVIRDGAVVERGSPAELKRRVGGEVLEVGVEGGSGAAATAAEVARECDALGPDATVETTDPGADPETTRGIRVTASDAGELGTDLLVALRDAGVDVTGFAVEEPSLDDVFLAIAGDGDGTLDEASGRSTAAPSGEGPA